MLPVLSAMQTLSSQTNTGGRGWPALRPRQLPHVRERRAGSDLVLYNPVRGCMHVLNTTAAFIWRLCDGSRSQEDIVRQLMTEFRIEGEADPERDLHQILKFLMQESLIDDLGPSRSGASPVVSKNVEGRRSD